MELILYACLKKKLSIFILFFYLLKTLEKCKFLNKPDLYKSILMYIRNQNKSYFYEVKGEFTNRIQILTIGKHTLLS